MNRYEDLINRHQKEISDLPLKFAIGNKEFDEMMKGWGLDPDKDLDKICSVGAGGFIQKKDMEKLREVRKRHASEMNDAIMSDATGDGFIYEMFSYELNNHEYGYTGDETEALAALGYDFKQIESDSRLKHGLEKAKMEIMKYEDAEASEIIPASELQTEKKDPAKAAASRDAAHELER